MKVLVIGSGGREHALAWQCSCFKEVQHVFVAPGNAGTALEHKISNIEIDSEDIPTLIEFAKSEAIDITIVGPEAPLVIGIVDDFRAQGLAIFGPTQLAAQLEGSKAFCKDFLYRNKIPTAFYQVFTEEESAIHYVKEKGTPIVIKADGLAAGKGVIIANTEQEAIDAIHDMLQGNRFGNAGSRVVIEEFLVGEEASFIVMVDGKNILPMATSQDHKARDNGDKGPNTGGMGAYSPAPIVSETIFENVIPTAEEYNVRIALESARTSGLKTPQTALRLVKDLESDYLTVAPDFEAWRIPTKEIPSTHVENPGMEASGPVSIDVFKECLPYSPLIHAKILTIDENEEEPNFPIAEMMSLIKESEREHTLSIEYEGWIPDINPHLDPIIKTEMSIALLKRDLG